MAQPNPYEEARAEVPHEPASPEDDSPPEASVDETRGPTETQSSRRLDDLIRTSVHTNITVHQMERTNAHLSNLLIVASAVGAVAMVAAGEVPAGRPVQFFALVLFAGLLTLVAVGTAVGGVRWATFRIAAVRPSVAEVRHDG